MNATHRDVVQRTEVDAKGLGFIVKGHTASVVGDVLILGDRLQIIRITWFKRNGVPSRHAGQRPGGGRVGL